MQIGGNSNPPRVFLQPLCTVNEIDGRLWSEETWEVCGDEDCSHCGPKSPFVYYQRSDIAHAPSAEAASPVAPDQRPTRNCTYCGPDWKGAHKHGCPRAMEDYAPGPVDD